MTEPNMPVNWAKDLPPDEVEEAFFDLRDELAAGLDRGDVTAFELALSAWRSTGLIYSDPKILAALTKKGFSPREHVEVERPA